MTEQLPATVETFSNKRDHVEEPEWYGEYGISIEPRRYAYDFSENDDVGVDRDYSHSEPGYVIEDESNSDARIWSTRGVSLKEKR